MTRMRSTPSKVPAMAKTTAMPASGRPRRYVARGQPRRGPAGRRPASIWSRPRSAICATSRCGRWRLLAAADLIACEDTRVTRKLLDHYGIATPLTPYHEHNAAEARPKLLARLAAGEAVALVSDAGTPLISDPGFKLVRAAREAGHAVTRAARRVGGAGGAERRRPADRPVLLRGLPAAEAGQRGRAHRRARAHPGDAGAVRERAAARRSARRSRRRARRRARPRSAAS